VLQISCSRLSTGVCCDTATPIRSSLRLHWLRPNSTLGCGSTIFVTRRHPSQAAATTRGRAQDRSVPAGTFTAADNYRDLYALDGNRGRDWCDRRPNATGLAQTSSRNSMMRKKVLVIPSYLRDRPLPVARFCGSTRLAVVRAGRPQRPMFFGTHSTRPSRGWWPPDAPCRQRSRPKAA
jgi:hypothetical protein